MALVRVSRKSIYDITRSLKNQEKMNCVKCGEDISPSSHFITIKISGERTGYHPECYVESRKK